MNPTPWRSQLFPSHPCRSHCLAAYYNQPRILSLELTGSNAGASSFSTTGSLSPQPVDWLVCKVLSSEIFIHPRALVETGICLKNNCDWIGYFKDKIPLPLYYKAYEFPSISRRPTYVNFYYLFIYLFGACPGSSACRPGWC